MPDNRYQILIVEDDTGLQSQLKWCFPDYDLLFAEERERAVELAGSHEPQVALLDLGLPPDPANASEGLRALREILVASPDTKVIVVTGNQERENALKAISGGAYDFYQKPVDAEVLPLIVERALRLHDLQMENRRLAQNAHSRLEGVIGSSPQMMRTCRMIEKVAPSDASVLLLGESGTGKEVLARALHSLSERRDSRFVAINCASIPDNLLESELFGYEKGAFTGATQRTIGKIEYADGGTLFLDEVGDLPLALQAKLLRFIQERVIERLGGRGEIEVDVRLVAATNRDLREMMGAGEFREDLYFRLSEISIEIPPLRERDGDASLIAHALLRKLAAKDRRAVSGFTEDALAAIEQYNWPGNVRELENVVRRAVIMAESARVSAEDLGLDYAEERAASMKLKDARENAEREVVARALGFANGNILRAAQVLGVSRPTLYALMSKFDLRPDS